MKSFINTLRSSIVFTLRNVFVLIACMSSLHAIASEVDDYEVYYGDFNDDGVDGDIYLHGVDSFVIIHGDIATPILLQGPQSFLFYEESLYSYQQPIPVSLASSDLLDSSKALLGQDYFGGDISSDGTIEFVIRGKDQYSPALLASIDNNQASIVASVDNSGYTFSDAEGSSSASVFNANLSDRNIPIAINEGVLAVGSLSFTLSGAAIEPHDPTATNQNVATPSAPVMAQPSGVNHANIDQVSTLGGAFTVTEQGAASYTIPIKVAQGTAGVAPKVALSYNSSSGSGLAGVGWGVSAGGAITRCGLTWQIDRLIKPVSYISAYNNSYCLNGQRLISKLENGELVYRTEVDTGVTVKFVGIHPDIYYGPPDYFEVTGRDGTITRFGGAQDHSSERRAFDDQGNGLSQIVYAWHQSEVQDNLGNRIEYVYSSSVDFFRLDEIRYGFGNSSQPSAKVSFVYRDINQHSNELGGYIAGYWFGNKSLLESIDSYNNGSLLRSYKIHYNEDDADKAFDDLYRVSRLQECTSNSNCLPATSFTWGQEEIDPVAENSQLSSAFYLETGAEGLVDYKLADINGDGLSDVIMLQQQVDEGDLWDPTRVDFYLRYAIQVSPGQFELRNFYSGQNKLQYNNRELKVDGGGVKLATYDANGDGRTDLAVYDLNSTPKWQLFISYPSVDDGKWYLKPVSSSDYSFPSSSKSTDFLDFNGDGIVDVLNNTSLYLGERNPSPPSVNLPYRFSSVSENYNNAGAIGAGYRFTNGYGDFNGDGLIDVIGWYTDSEGNENCVITQKIAVFYQQQDANGNISLSPYDLVVEESNGTTSTMGSCDPQLNHYPIYRLNVADINGDGKTDIYWMKKNTAFPSFYSGGRDIKYVLNQGNENFSEPRNLISSNSDSHSFVDVDGDGDNDFIYRLDYSDGASGDQSIQVKKWNGNGFGPAETIVQDESDNAMNAFVDINADGAVDRLRIKSSNVYLDVWSNYAPSHRIEAIENGLGNRTQISYELMNKTDHYMDTAQLATSTTLDWGLSGSSVPGMVQEVFDSFDIESFYNRLVNPFEDVAQDHSLYPESVAPILEYMAPIPIVTSVKSSLPTADNPNNMADVEYHYQEAKIQASGRGFLGFKKLVTVDGSTSIQTSTTYRQDWPFIGMPVKTVSYIGSNVLKESIVQYALQGVKIDDSDPGETIESFRSTYKNQGSKALGHLVVNQYKQVDNNYELKNNGFDQGNLIKRVEITKQLDEFGNAISIIEDVFSGENTSYASRKEVINDYGQDYYSKRMGRLYETSVTQRQPGKPSHNATSLFSYVGLGSNDCDLDAIYTGMLCKETTFPDDEQNKVDTFHYYDEFGNLSFSKKVSVDGIRLSGFTEYDSQGRYVERTYGVFSDQANTSGTVPDSRYASAAGSIGANVQLLQDVVSRDAHGLVTEAKKYLDADAYLTEKVWVTSFGTVYFSADSTGAFSQTLPSKSNLSNCPAGTVYSVASLKAGGAQTKVCKDVLGRSLRELSLGFNGQQWAAADIEYNSLGKIKRKSEPYFIGQPVYWSDIQYDKLGRSVITKHAYNEIGSDGNPTSVRAQSSIQYLGLTKIITNAKGQQKTEVSSVVGELDHVITHEGTVYYEYDVLGNMNKMISPSATTIINYDNLGRKKNMSDPDKGYWQYHYNAFGDLICQVDAKNQTVVNDYDFAGRLIQRVDRKAGGNCPNPTGDIVANAQWFYDTAENGLGQLVEEKDLESNFSKRISYDRFGRGETTVTQFPGVDGKITSHFEKATYDQFGRVFQVFDAARNSASYQHNGIHHHYNGFGYLESVTDAANNGNGTVFYEVIDMDARGNVVDAQYGDGVVDIGQYHLPNSGFLNNLRATVGSFDVQDLTIRWDHIGNVFDRTELGVGLLGQSKNITETFGYDNANRLTSYLVTGPNISQHSVSVNYTGLGNILNKSDVGTQNYQYTSGRPHAVTQAGGVTYSYDANGNMYQDTSGRAIEYSVFDKAVRIDVSGKHRTEFSYGVDRSRFKRVDTPLNASNQPQSNETTTTLYVGGVEKVYHADGSVQWKRSVAGVALITHTFDAAQNETKTTDYLIKDHLGSINYIVASNGDVKEEMAFDPWGKRRNTVDWRSLQQSSLLSNYSIFAKPTTTRGFTGHEMLDDSGIIHMNGRIYDGHLGRFLQADPFIQEPTLPSSLNRYSYLFNNPLNATDPSGYFVVSAFLSAAILKVAADDRTQGQIIMVGATAIAAWACGPCAAAVTAGFTAGIAYINGYTADQAFLMGAQAGMNSLLSMGAFANIGHVFKGTGPDAGWFDFGTKNGFWHIAAHATAGGVLSVVQGGKFGHGFASAGVVKGLAPVIDFAVEKHGYWGGMIASMVIGGTVSDLSGGKFANGAITAAFQYHFNNCGGDPGNCEAEAEQKVSPRLNPNCNIEDGCTINLAKLCSSGDAASCASLSQYNAKHLKIATVFIHERYPDLLSSPDPQVSNISFDGEMQPGVGGGTSPITLDITLNQSYASQAKLIDTLSHELAHRNRGRFGLMLLNAQDFWNGGNHGTMHSADREFGEHMGDLYRSQ